MGAPIRAAAAPPDPVVCSTQAAAARAPAFWIGVASRNHVQRGVAGGFCQLCHGKAAPLRRMAVGDWIAYYSPTETLAGREPCQRFTALGEVVGAAVYPFEMAPGFVPHRRDVRFVPVTEVAVRPLLPVLDFISDKTRWGGAFRFGHLKIGPNDFARLAQGMAPGAGWAEAVEKAVAQAQGVLACNNSAATRRAAMPKASPQEPLF